MRPKGREEGEIVFQGHVLPWNSKVLNCQKGVFKSDDDEKSNRMSPEMCSLNLKTWKLIE